MVRRMRTRSATHVQQEEGKTRNKRAKTPVGKRELQSPVLALPRGREGFPVGDTNPAGVQMMPSYPVLQVAGLPQSAAGNTTPNPTPKEVEVNVWAWRYGKDREWKSIRECVMKIGEQRIVVMKGDDVLQEIAFSNLEHAYNYATSSRVIISAKSGYAMFLSLDKKYHIWFKKCMQANNLPSTEVSYGVFFRQQKSLSFPPAPYCEIVNDGSSQQSSQDSSVDELLQLQAQLDSLKQQNHQLNTQLCQYQSIHSHPQQLPQAFCLPQQHGSVPVATAFHHNIPAYHAPVSNTPYPTVYPLATHVHQQYEYV